jgi:hypothetical protein
VDDRQNLPHHEPLKPNPTADDPRAFTEKKLRSRLP